MTSAAPSLALAAFLAPIQGYLDRPDVVEICINRPGEVFVEDPRGWEQVELPGLSYEFLSGLVSTISSHARQKVGAETPLLSASLPGGERVQVVLPPAVPAGTISLTIRKPAHRTFSLEALIGAGMFDAVETDPEALGAEDARLLELHRDRRWPEFLAGAVAAKKNILISGATGSGKTTLSKALIPLIPSNERLITIEDTLELELPQPNVVRLLYSKGGQGDAKVTARDLLEASLRMRPDRIFLQELRDASAFHYLRNVNTGHSGSITTIHANSARLAFEQLALLVKESEAGRDLSRAEIKAMIGQMIDVVLQVRKTPQGRRVTEVWFDPRRKLEGPTPETAP
ncbi:P-type DNA transfer ATPase VirB11 [Cereibacter sphaeroides]|uniref:P-type DNA transfer ATPase VirB11 n=1 Tax=Cereibacter sphaeroides TaxID=1063 RepID=UPI001F3999FA|nr:P-type DNA transfer ATPase VirB11 [Cereibacter sphaeroides]MCE6958122.1 P-type DNA transfer ATPase VirB11 [Cereibacter sphaeroides]MCE6971641.1 P-type DNA transfer ATPase VirB11 [Cereibacter sphaeroides]